MNTERLQHNTDTASMLLCQQFGGCHDGTLIAVERGHQQGSRRYSRFTCANIALQEATHGPGLSEVSKNFADNAPLGRGETKRQGSLKWLIGGDGRPECRIKRVEHVCVRACVLYVYCGAGGFWRRGGINENFREVNFEGVALWSFTLPASAAFLHTKLDQKEFVEGQTAACREQGGIIFRVVYVRDRIG